MTLSITWATNSKPQPTGGYGVRYHPSELQTVLKNILPHIQTLSVLSWPPVEEPASDSSKNLLIGLLLIADYMRQEGVNPDPLGILRWQVDLLVRK